MGKVEKLANFRALPGRMHLESNPGPACNHWVYAVDHPKEAFDVEDYWLGVQHHLARTDRVTVVSWADDGGWDEAVFICIVSEARHVIMQRDGDWSHYGVAISKTLEAVHKGAGVYQVVDVENNRVIAKGLDKVTAHGMVAAHAAKEADAA